MKGGYRHRQGARSALNSLTETRRAPVNRAAAARMRSRYWLSLTAPMAKLHHEALIHLREHLAVEAEYLPGAEKESAEVLRIVDNEIARLDRTRKCLNVGS